MYKRNSNNKLFEEILRFKMEIYMRTMCFLSYKAMKKIHIFSRRHINVKEKKGDEIWF